MNQGIEVSVWEYNKIMFASAAWKLLVILVCEVAALCLMVWIVVSCTESWWRRRERRGGECGEGK